MVKPFKYMAIMMLIATPAWAHSPAATHGRIAGTARRPEHTKIAAARPAFALAPADTRLESPVIPARYDGYQEASPTEVDIPMGGSGLVGAVGLHRLDGAQDSHELEGLAAERFAKPASLVGATFSYRF
jgi:hypothetical protein